MLAVKCFVTAENLVSFNHQNVILCVSQLPKAEEIKLYARPNSQLVYFLLILHILN